MSVETSPERRLQIRDELTELGQQIRDLTARDASSQGEHN